MATTTTFQNKPQPLSYEQGLAEISRLGQEYNTKKAAGDMAGANAAHTWANQIRNGIGMTNYNTTTGAPLTANTGQVGGSGVAGTGTDTGSYGQSAGSFLASVMNGGIGSNTPAPNINLEYPTGPSVSFDEAYAQAKSILGPQQALALSQIRDKYAQQKELLPQQLNARGQLYGGLRAGGATELTQQEAKASEQLGLEGEAKIAELARQIYNEEEQRAQAEAQAQFNARVQQANLDMQKWQGGIQAEQNTMGNRINIAGKLYDAYAAGQISQAEYEQSLERLQLEQAFEEKMFDKESSTISATDKAKLAQQWALANLSGSSGSGGGGGGTSTGGNSADATQGFLARVLKYRDPALAKEFVNANAMAAIADGVDMNAISKAASAFYGKPSWEAAISPQAGLGSTGTQTTEGNWLTKLFSGV